MAVEVGSDKPVESESRASFNTKPYAVRLGSPDPDRPSPGTMMLSHVRVAGEPIGYDGETHELLLAGDRMSIREWMTLRHRIDSLLIQNKELEKVRPPDDVRSGVASSFLSRNWRSLGSHRKGYWKKPPWFLRWAYSAVVTNEEYVK